MKKKIELGDLVMVSNKSGVVVDTYKNILVVKFLDNTKTQCKKSEVKVLS
jgi:hypothetical protein